MSPTIYLISGSNRGIGLGLVKELATNHKDTVIFAGARDPANAKELKAVADKFPDRVHIVKLVMADVEGNKAVAKEIKEKYGRVDIIINSAGIASHMGPATELPPDTFAEHFNVNVNGLLVLSQTMLDLLKASSAPKLIPLSSAAGSLTAYISYPTEYTCYGATKAALNYLARKIHFENEWIVCFPFSPGVVLTDMATQNRSMDRTGSLAPVQDAIGITAEQCAKTLISIIENATREKDGGEFINIDGTKVPW